MYSAKSSHLAYKSAILLDYRHNSHQITKYPADTTFFPGSQSLPWMTKFKTIMWLIWRLFDNSAWSCTFDKDFLIGHLRVCYKKVGSKYFIKNSTESILKLSKKEMEKHLDNVIKMKSTFYIISYKN